MTPNTSPLSEFAAADLRFVVGYGVTRNYPKNVILISEGDRSDSLYVIGSGKVKVYASDDQGKEVILNILGPGEHFGELALIDEGPRSASVMTVEPSSITIVSKADFERCLVENPTLAVTLIRALSHRIRSLTENVKNLAMLDVYGRVARTLLSLAEERDGVMIIEQRLTHADIASMVGASREMVSRIMKELVSGGYLRLQDKKIIIRGKLPARW